MAQTRETTRTNRHHNIQLKDMLLRKADTRRENLATTTFLIFSTLLFLTQIICCSAAMTWANTWKDILKGGPSRWKVDDITAKRIALGHILEHAPSTTSADPLRIFCPLAGDDPFVVHAWKEGHSVTSIDLVPEAVAAMRQQFATSSPSSLSIEEDWESEESGSTTIWKHKSGRATLYVGDVLERRPELEKSFDAVYDKDSFGALDLGMRSAFCERLASYLRENGIIYTEVKFKPPGDGRLSGPPFHVEKDDLMKLENFGSQFEYLASLGQVYEIGMGGMEQHGHVLRRRVG